MEKNKKDQELNSEDAQVKQPETDESVPPQAANESREQSDKTAQVKTKEKQTEKQENKAPADSANRKKQANFIAPYAKAYPGEKIFLVTSDRQVFLLKDKGLAENHQRSLKNGEKIQTIKVK